jgi:hypothetical protein
MSSKSLPTYTTTKAGNIYTVSSTCIQNKDCVLNTASYTDTCDGMTGDRTMTVKIASEMSGTGMKSCETVAKNLAKQKDSTIGIVTATKANGVVTLKTVCTKTKLYTIIAAVVLLILIIIGVVVFV